MHLVGGDSDGSVAASRPDLWHGGSTVHKGVPREEILRRDSHSFRRSRLQFGGGEGISCADVRKTYQRTHDRQLPRMRKSIDWMLKGKGTSFSLIRQEKTCSLGLRRTACSAAMNRCPQKNHPKVRSGHFRLTCPTLFVFYPSRATSTRKGGSVFRRLAGLALSFMNDQ
jgi:hypothetical protein